MPASRWRAARSMKSSPSRRAFPEAVAAGKIKFTGNPMRLGELMVLMDEFPRMFEIVEPKRTAVR